MARALFVAILVGMLLVPGCVDSETFDDVWTDLEAKPQYQERTLFNTQVEFSADGTVDPSSPPGGSEDIGDRWTTNITIPEGTRSITVVFTVNFTTPDPSEAPLPASPPNTPNGQIRVFTQGPNAANESQNVTYQESAEGGFDFQRPTAGDWTLGLDAIGQGTVTFRVFGTVQVTDN